MIVRDAANRPYFPNGIDMSCRPALDEVTNFIGNNSSTLPYRLYKLYRVVLNAAGIPPDNLLHAHQLVDASFLTAAAEISGSDLLARLDSVRQEHPDMAHAAATVYCFLVSAVQKLREFSANKDLIETEQAKYTAKGWVVASLEHVANRAAFMDTTFTRAADIVSRKDAMDQLYKALEFHTPAAVDPCTVNSWNVIEQYWQDLSSVYGPSLPLYLPLGNYDNAGKALELATHVELIYNMISGICEAPTMFGAHLLIIMGRPTGSIAAALEAKEGAVDIDPSMGVVIASAIRAKPHWTASSYLATVLQSLFGSLAADLFESIERFTLIGPTTRDEKLPPADRQRKNGDVAETASPASMIELADCYEGATYRQEQTPHHMYADLERTVDGIVPAPIRVVDRPVGIIDEALADPFIWNLLKLPDEIDRGLLLRKMQELCVMGTMPARDTVVTPDVDSFWPDLPAVAARKKAQAANDSNGPSHHA